MIAPLLILALSVGLLQENPAQAKAFLEANAGSKLDRYEQGQGPKIESFLKAAGHTADVWRIREVFVWKALAPRRGYIVALIANTFTVPGQSRAHVLQFDDIGHRTGSSSFATGWRTYVEGAALSHRAPYGQVLEFELRPGINGRRLSRLFIGFANSRPVLFRVEGEGKFADVFYSAWNHVVGPLPPDRTTSQWRASLMSKDAKVVLEALTWLAGRHHGPTPIPESVYHEPLKSAISWHEAARSPGVRSLVEKHRASSDPWTAEAARMAWVALRKVGPGESQEPREEAAAFRIEDLEPGEQAGPELQPGDRAAITFALSDESGRVLARIEDESELFEWEVGEGKFCPGFEEGVVGMKKGGIRRVRIPWPLGFRSLRLPNVPPYSNLVATVRLHKFKRP